jgi:hypothetical protein
MVAVVCVQAAMLVLLDVMQCVAASMQSMRLHVTKMPTHGCAPGEFPSHGSSRCASCPPGKFSATTGSQACMSCRSGRYAPFHGQAGCHHCGKDQFQFMGTCFPCSQARPGAWVLHNNCAHCVPGQYQDAARYGVCHPCPNGKWAPRASMQCTNETRRHGQPQHDRVAVALKATITWDADGKAHVCKGSLGVGCSPANSCPTWTHSTCEFASIANLRTGYFCVCPPGTCRQWSPSYRGYWCGRKGAAAPTRNPTAEPTTAPTSTMTPTPTPTVVVPPLATPRGPYSPPSAYPTSAPTQTRFSSLAPPRISADSPHIYSPPPQVQT